MTDGVGFVRPVVGSVASLAELQNAIADLVANHTDCRILLRGQTHLHPTVRSGRARPDVTFALELERGWSSLGTRLLGLSPDSIHRPHVKAILQHYGMATHYLDLTTNAAVAAWFAVNQYQARGNLWIGNSFRRYTLASYSEANAEGYVLVLAIPNQQADHLLASHRLVNLAALPRNFVRPKRQFGWLLYDRPPTRPSGTDFWVGSVRVDPSIQLETDEVTLFPPPSVDAVYSTLLNQPFVQVPMAFFPSEHDDADAEKEERDGSDFFTPATRLLDVPLYGGFDAHDPKWSDFTLYEPKSVREWKGWHHDLASQYDGVSGDIANAKKITVAADAWQLLHASNAHPLVWPDFGSSGVFFQCAPFDHDKVADHQAPYHGVWLEKNDDLVIETPTTSGTEHLTVHAGHLYLFQNGELTRQEVERACTCGEPSSHDSRVRAMLRLSTLVAQGEILLFPHPSLIPDWYVAILSR